MKFRSMLAVPLTALLLSISPFSNAQTAPRSYAVMSLVGDAITVHAIRPSVGTRGEAESRNVLPITETVFDTAALRYADGAIKQAQPGAKTVLMMTSDAGLYAAQNAMFDAAHLNKENRDYLISLLKDRGVTHLLLVTKERDSARFKLTNGAAGKGSLEGLGFYIDETTRLRNGDTQDSARGMLGPFAYVKVRLLDASTLAVVREISATQSRIIIEPSASSNAVDIWATMPSTKKITYLEELICEAMQEAIPKVLAK
jgi:hypothetical protein